MTNFISKYGKAAKNVLNDVLPRKGGDVNWKDFSAKHQISNNFGAALQRIGVVLKVKNGHYKSNVTDYYVSDKTAFTIAQIIQKHKLMQFPKDASAIANAKTELINSGIVRTNQPKTMQTPKPIQQPKAVQMPTSNPQPIQQPKVRKVKVVVVQAAPNTTVGLAQSMLSSFKTSELVSEIARRVATQNLKTRARMANEIKKTITNC